jgi:iron complex outermembrane receptor protein
MLSDEGFMSNLNAVNMLKLRASWGINGNQEIPNKISNYVLGASIWVRPILDSTSAVIPGYGYMRTPNPNLKWEETHQWDIGLDFSLLDNRIRGSLDYFDKRTKDLLFQIPVSNAPTSLMWVNMDSARVHNKGYEVEISADIFRDRTFNWTSTLIFSTIEGKVEGLHEDIPVGEFGAYGVGLSYIQILRNEEEIGSFYGNVFEGFDSQGYGIYKVDSLGEPVREIIGQALPDFTWGWTNFFQVGNFDLSFLISGTYGNDVFNNLFISDVIKQNFYAGNNITLDMLNSPENFGNSNIYSSRYIEDGTFVRLSNITFGYNLNVSNISWLSGLRLYITGTNLYTWTQYSGFDPEVNTLLSTGNGIPPLGVDASGYPRPITLQLGLNVNF